MNAPSSAPSARPTPLKPKWVAVGMLLLVVYLLLRPWLIERYGWDLPGLTDAKPRVNVPGDTASPRERRDHRPVDVSIVPEQGEPVAEEKDADEQVASNDIQPKPMTPPADVPANSPTGAAPAKPPGPSGAKSVDKPATPVSTPPASNSKPTNSPAPAKPPGGALPAKWSGLKSIGRGKFESPSGLVYDQYRIDHVMEHSRDNTDKPSHGVFTATTQDEVLALIDEAFDLTKKRGPPQVITEDEGDRTAYTVNLNRQIGRAGGQSGARRRNPPLQKIKIVVEEARVITAYPTN